MKKKLTLVVALVIALVTLLSSCGKAEPITIGDVLDEDAIYDETTHVLKRGSEISALSGTRPAGASGDLVYYTDAPDFSLLSEPSFERHVVYNVEEGKVLYNATESKQIEINITLDSNFFIVHTTRYNLNADGTRNNASEKDTVLYDKLGNNVDDVEGHLTAINAIDTVYFNGKCYRADDDGKLFYKFDYSVLSAFPESIDKKANEQYYDFVNEGDKGVKIYDDEFNFVNEVEIPGYATMTGVIFLEDEKLLIQYTYQLDEDEKKFSFMYNATLGTGATGWFSNMSKYNLHTVVYDPAKDECKEVKCSYLLLSLFDEIYEFPVIDLSDEETFEQIDTEYTQALTYGFKIIDNHVCLVDEQSFCTLGVNEKGEIFEIEDVNGEALGGFEMVGENLWIADGFNFKYLIDGEDTVIGEVSYASRNGEFFYKDGMIFDSDLKLIYNCASNKMTVYAVLDGAFLLKNYDGELFLYNGRGKPERIITKKELETCSVTVLSENLFVVYDYFNLDDVNYDFYNAQGDKIFSTDAIPGVYLDPEAITITKTETSVLVPYIDALGRNVYYRFH